MKLSLPLLLLLLSSCVTKYAAIDPSNPLENFVPLDGCILNNGNKIYISKYETSNIEYQKFTDYLKLSNPELHYKCTIDSTNWVTSFEYNYNNFLMKDYHRAAPFYNYPVVNISHFAASQYCRWLTDQCNSTSKRERRVFRLPTEEEYRCLFSKLLIDYSSDDPSYYSKYEFNLGIKGHYAIDGAIQFAPVNWYPQSEKGLCNIIGNVSEFTAAGDIIGGSWNTIPSEVEDVQGFKETEVTLGFRVVIELIE